MSGFKVGDLVVKRGGSCTIMPRGTICRVTWVGYFAGSSTCPACNALHLDGWDHGNRPGWAGFNFRKIRPASDEFIAVLRACKPERIGEPSNV